MIRLIAEWKHFLTFLKILKSENYLRKSDLEFNDLTEWKRGEGGG